MLLFQYLMVKTNKSESNIYNIIRWSLLGTLKLNYPKKKNQIEFLKHLSIYCS